MKKWFDSQSRLVQIILLLIPFVNWIVEIGVRWSKALNDKDVVSIVMAVVVTIVGLPFGWIDLVWCLLFNHLILG